MVNNIIDAISIKLDSVFNVESNVYRIYADTDVIQDLEEPCFFIAVLQPSQKPYPIGRYYRAHPFDVHFFPAENYDNAALIGMADELFEVLEYVTMTNGDLIRGAEMSYNIVDGVLHFFVSYNMFLRTENTAENMETLDIITGTEKPAAAEPEEPEEPEGQEPANGTEEQNNGN